MAKQTPFLPYEGSKPKDTHIRLTRSMLLSESYSSLSFSAAKLYNLMKLWAKGQMEFDYSWSLAQKASFSKKSNKTYIKAKNELIAKGFIECIRTSKCSRLPNRYKLSSKWNTKK